MKRGVSVQGSVWPTQQAANGPARAIVGLVCMEHERLPDAYKMEKMVTWLGWRNLTEVLAFRKAIKYYRIWVRGISIVAAPTAQVLEVSMGTGARPSHRDDYTCFDNGTHAVDATVHSGVLGAHTANRPKPRETVSGTCTGG